MATRSYLETDGFDGAQDDEESPEIRYGSIGVRLYAFVIDSLVLFAINCVALVFLANRPVPSDGFEFWSSFFLFEFAISAVYMSAMESSPLQASRGKLMSGLKVTDLHGKRISLLRAIGRNVAKVVSGAPLFLGYVLAATSPKRQAVHDIFACTLVIDDRPTPTR